LHHLKKKKVALLLISHESKLLELTQCVSEEKNSSNICGFVFTVKPFIFIIFVKAVSNINIKGTKISTQLCIKFSYKNAEFNGCEFWKSQIRELLEPQKYRALQYSCLPQIQPDSERPIKSVNFV
jgi:hypothetical protein